MTLPSAKITLQKLGELILDKSLQKGRPAYLSAASGLVRHGAHAFVIADDELHLGIFAAEDLRADKPLRLLAGKLPHDLVKRKKQKPDFEVLALLPAAAEMPHGALLIMGSGSRNNRDVGLLVPLNAAGVPHRDKSLLIDFSGLYAALQREFGVVNIEGAVVQRNYLLLLQRGNKGLATNAMVKLDLATLIREIGLGMVGATALCDIRTYALGEIRGVPWGFSDATCLPDGRLLALAVAEDTVDAYADGVSLGSCLCQFDAANELEAIVHLDLPIKAEGIAVWSAPDKTLAFVTDADDPAIPAALYTARFDNLF